MAKNDAQLSFPFCEHSHFVGQPIVEYLKLLCVDDILSFLITCVSTFFLKATDPNKPTKRKATDDFQTSADRKLIISDDEDEEEGKEPGSKRKRKPGTVWRTVFCFILKRNLRLHLFIYLREVIITSVLNEDPPCLVEGGYAPPI